MILKLIINQPQLQNYEKIVIYFTISISFWDTNLFAQVITVPELPSLPNADTDIQQMKGNKEICTDSIIQFKDEGLKFYCLHAADRNRDGEISYNEAAMAKQINCEYGGRRFLRYITTYEDLVFFVNLEKLFLGVSNIKELNLTANKKLKLINMNALDELDTLFLAEGCNPEIIYPLSKQDGGLTIFHK